MKTPEVFDFDRRRPKESFVQAIKRLQDFGDVAYAIVTKENGIVFMARDGAELDIPALKCGQGAESAHVIARLLEAASFGDSTHYRHDALHKTKLVVTRVDGRVRLQAETFIK